MCQPLNKPRGGEVFLFYVQKGKALCKFSYDTNNDDLFKYSSGSNNRINQKLNAASRTSADKSDYSNEELRMISVHAGLSVSSVEPAVPIVPAIVHTSSYRVHSVKHFQDILNYGGYAYIRLRSPTCEAAEKAVNELENGYGSLVFGSGMAAISAVLLAFLRPGDHVVAGNPLYGCTYEILTQYIAARFNIELTFVDGANVEAFKAAIRSNTKLLYGETPSNPILSILDVEAFAALSIKSAGQIITVIDSTFASPLLLKPIQYGADIVIHSATKYLGGHDDLCAGVITTRTQQQWQTVFNTRKVFGGILSPHDASLLLRGIRSSTIGVRLERESDTAYKIALYLVTHPAVCKVHYPGLASHPQHGIARKQMKKFGAMVAFEVFGGQNAAIKVCDSLQIFMLALSLGGVDSLVEHPSTMTHGPLFMSDEDRKAANIEPGLIRLSVGLEDAEDLISDLRQALENIKKLINRH